MKRVMLMVLLAGLAAGVCGQTAEHRKMYRRGWIDLNKNGKKDVYEDPAAPIEKRVDDLLRQMTLEEKTCQLGTLYGYGAVTRDSLPTPEWKNRVWKDGLGNIDEHLNGEWKRSSLDFPYYRHAEALNKVQTFFVEETRLGIPVDFTNEGIRGLKHEKSTFFPAQIGLGSTWNKSLVREIGHITGLEAKVLGYTNVYSPILDLARDPRWGRTVEAYGEDPYLVGELGRQQVEGIQGNRVVASPKHFAVYGVPVGGRDCESRTDPHATPQEVHELHLEPFRVAFQEAGALGTMCSHNDYNGTPISGSRYLLTTLLRDEWGFKGYVVSDSWSIGKLWKFYHVAGSNEEAVAQELKAGINVRTNFRVPEEFIGTLRKALQDGLVTEAELDRRVREVLYVKFWLGLFDEPYVKQPKQADEVVNCEAHREVSLRAGRESIVLLKNENGLLPLSKSIKKVAVIGPLADNRSAMLCRYGSHNPEVVTGLAGIKNYLEEKATVLYAKGCAVRDRNFPKSDVMYFPMTDKEQEEIDEAVEIAKQAEVAILFVGDDGRTIGESRSRVNLDFSGRQKELIRAVQATGTPVVLVMFNGRPVTMNWEAEYVPAIVEAWYPGAYAGQVVAEVLWGDYNPGGKLPVTFPKSVGQIPWAFPFKPNANGKGFARVDGSLYPFGFGLSYTTFEVSDLKVSSGKIKKGEVLTVSCRVKNTGERAGDEVVQLYLNDEVSSVSRYVQELCGFERVSLQPGEEKTVTFRVGERAYGMYDADNRFVVEPGKFTLSAGNSSENLPLKAEFWVE